MLNTYSKTNGGITREILTIKLVTKEKTMKNSWEKSKKLYQQPSSDLSRGEVQMSTNKNKPLKEEIIDKRINEAISKFKNTTER
jgi:hypothetical protein